MSEFKKPYFILYNATADALRLLAKNEIANSAFVLLKAQYDAEEAYISWGEEHDAPLQE